MSTIRYTARQVAQLLSSFQAQLASTTASLGAALVGVADAGSYFSSATVEAVLAELGILRPDNIITDPGNGGAIPVTRSGCVALVTAGAETRTLAAPTFVNQMLTLYFKTDGGDCVVTAATGLNAGGNTRITLNDENDSIQLIGAYNGTALRWRVSQNDGTTLG